MLTERTADFPNAKKCKSPQPLLGSQTYYILMHLKTLFIMCIESPLRISLSWAVDV